MTLSPRSGGAVLVDQLALNGVRRVFLVPGESYLAALDALYDHADTIETVVCRQEGGAAFMAEAHGKLTGEVGVCFVTRGPGACNAAIGVHTAMQDSTPLILLIGQVGREMRHREAFQEIDVDRLFGWTTKWAVEVNDPRRLPEIMARAFRIAQSGRPGPVAIALPEDMLTEMVSVADAPPGDALAPYPDPGALAALAQHLSRAARPLMIVGGGGWTAAAADDIRRFASAWALPTACSFRRQDIVDNALPVYAGELGTSVDKGLIARIRESDLLIAVGTRLSEIATQGYELINIPVPQIPLIHVHADLAELGRIYQPVLALNAGPGEFAAAAAALPAPAAPPWAAWTERVRADYLASATPTPCPGPLDMNAVMATLAGALPADTVMVNDAGNFTGWLQRFWCYRHFKSQLGPANGAMGYAVPAAVAAAIECAGQRPVVAFVGDGGFLMTGQELATAIRHGAAPVIVVVDNGSYGTIRMHQERHYPNRVVATDLANPDFAAYARAFGAHGETVAETAQFAPALERALAAAAKGVPALLCLKLSIEVITSRTTLTKMKGG
ncbi:thiamine pyrophosphate-dependent enzyme [Zavarzinia compransoris]|uniref:Thiamine pyrophosphate-binding protein n=1 Tax=Zavarzinia compransoris TaxID=1264899 RepID=A0A317E0D4_9PROT|nr:thiamine pyrophosphate-dependent enzyme [Zavarzinia compransoris]PWR20102.1 thiamine pyrophosphate-binding protein [Zavarzinia compransoris]TDP43319.1 acetolactate synthase large subunit [Zavarzinia compransoris]